MRNANYEYYYERRPHQYDHQDIRHNLIVTAPALIKSFVSVVLEEPHKIHYYYGTLLEEYNRDKFSELFSDSDYPGLYFAAHHIASKVKISIGGHLHMKEWVFHISLLVKKLISPALSKTSNLDDKKFLNTLKKIDDEFSPAFDTAIKIISNLKLSGNHNRSPDITAKILKKLNEHQFPRTSTSTEKRETSSLRETQNNKIKSNPKIRESIINKTHISDLGNTPNILKLPNGNYSAIIVENSSDNNLIKTSYGPYRIDIFKDPSSKSNLTVGSRVQFEAISGKYTQTDS